MKVGDTVLFVGGDTLTGPQEWPATVTRVDDEEQGLVSLTVSCPDGSFVTAEHVPPTSGSHFGHWKREVTDREVMDGGANTGGDLAGAAEPEPTAAATDGADAALGDAGG